MTFEIVLYQEQSTHTALQSDYPILHRLQLSCSKDGISKLKNGGCHIYIRSLLGQHVQTGESILEITCGKNHWYETTCHINDTLSRIPALFALRLVPISSLLKAGWLDPEHLHYFARLGQ